MMVTLSFFVVPFETHAPQLIISMGFGLASNSPKRNPKAPQQILGEPQATGGTLTT